MIKTLELDGRIVTVYPKKIEINGNEVIAPGKVVVEWLPVANEINTLSHALTQQGTPGRHKEVEISE